MAVRGAYSERDAERGLLVAAENGYTDCVDVLLRAGISPEVLDSSRGSALSTAASAGHDKVVRQLAAAVSCSGLNAQWRGSTALHRAVATGHSTCVEALIDAGANVNAVDSAGDTPLIVAAKHCRQSLAAMKCLVQAGCDLERVDAERRTALHYSCYRAVGAELLLSAGAKTDMQVTVRWALWTIRVKSPPRSQFVLHAVTVKFCGLYVELVISFCVRSAVSVCLFQALN